MNQWLGIIALHLFPKLYELYKTNKLKTFKILPPKPIEMYKSKTFKILLPKPIEMYKVKEYK